MTVDSGDYASEPRTRPELIKNKESPTGIGGNSKKLKEHSKSKSSLKRKKGVGKKNKTHQPPTNIPQLCVEYLKRWKNDHSNWKFEKARQIRLLSIVFDKEKIPKDSFEIFIEYMQKATESSKQKLTGNAKEVISKVEAYENLSEQEKLETTKPEMAYKGYQRARKIVQFFD